MGSKRRETNADERKNDDANEPSAAATVPPPKRQRVSRACDQCRNAREKCDGIQPLCFPCASQNRTCSWEEPKKKRGVQTGYIRTLEMALGWIFDKIPGSEDSLYSLLTHEGGQGRSLLTGKDSAAGNRLYKRWRRSTVQKEIDRVLSGGDSACAKSATGSPPRDGSDDENDESTCRGDHSTPSPSETHGNVPLGPGNEPPVISSRRIFKDEHENNLTIYETQTSSQNPTHRHQPQIQPNQYCEVPPVCQLPANHWRLLDVYFSYTHSWFPVLEKHDVLKTAYAYPHDGLRLSREDVKSAGHAELWAAFALSSYQEAASRDEENQSRHGQNDFMELYQTARNLIPTEDGHFDIRHINALLLLVLINLAREDLTAAWLLTGTASRLALRLGIDGSSQTEMTRRSSHTYMGCFILDTILSARLKLRPHLTADVARVSMPLLGDDLDEWQPWVPCSGFGPQHHDMCATSRIPTRSVSSLSILYRTHRVLSQKLLMNPSVTTSSTNEELVHVTRTIHDFDNNGYLSSFIITGEPPAQLPSAYIIRLAFILVSTDTSQQPYFLVAVLRCVESYIENFGVCGLPPLFSTYVKLAKQGHATSLLRADDLQLCTRVEKALASVWKSRETGFPNSSTNANHGQSQTPGNLSLTSTLNTTPKTASTPALTNANTTIPIPSPPIARDTYSIRRSSAVLDFPGHLPPGESGAFPINTPANTAPVSYDGSNIPGSDHRGNFPVQAQQNFGRAAFDYDAILDDIASIDRTDLMESDPQFMANLGLRPGTNLADVFSNEFMGFS
ncbi:hypothetical protein F5Y15DRAFT_403525 [Xylariaceae sp. FL0016]|nr:hypothetical protein F5Y15DRAFT_403525 [Xylariaceae sp. FL0016]